MALSVYGNHSQYRFTRLPMGLNIFPGAFLQVANIIKLSPNNYQMYIVDLVVACEKDTN